MKLNLFILIYIISLVLNCNSKQFTNDVSLILGLSSDKEVELTKVASIAKKNAKSNNLYVPPSREYTAQNKIGVSGSVEQGSFMDSIPFLVVTNVERYDKILAKQEALEAERKKILEQELKLKQQKKDTENKIILQSLTSSDIKLIDSIQENQQKNPTQISDPIFVTPTSGIKGYNDISVSLYKFRGKFVEKDDVSGKYFYIARVQKGRMQVLIDVEYRFLNLQLKNLRELETVKQEHIKAIDGIDTTNQLKLPKTVNNPTLPSALQTLNGITDIKTELVSSSVVKDNSSGIYSYSVKLTKGVATLNIFIFYQFQTDSDYYRNLIENITVADLKLYDSISESSAILPSSAGFPNFPSSFGSNATLSIGFVTSMIPNSSYSNGYYNVDDNTGILEYKVKITKNAINKDFYVLYKNFRKNTATSNGDLILVNNITSQDIKNSDSISVNSNQKPSDAPNPSFSSRTDGVVIQSFNIRKSDIDGVYSYSVKISKGSALKNLDIQYTGFKREIFTFETNSSYRSNGKSLFRYLDFSSSYNMERIDLVFSGETAPAFSLAASNTQHVTRISGNLRQGGFFANSSNWFTSPKWSLQNQTKAILKIKTTTSDTPVSSNFAVISPMIQKIEETNVNLNYNKLVQSDDGEHLFIVYKTQVNVYKKNNQEKWNKITEIATLDSNIFEVASLKSSYNGSLLALSLVQKNSTSSGSIKIYKKQRDNSYFLFQSISKFATSVAFGSHGSKLAIGNPFHNSNNGSIDIYEKSNDSYTLKQTINGTSGLKLRFGQSIALSQNGNRLVNVSLYLRENQIKPNPIISVFETNGQNYIEKHASANLIKRRTPNYQSADVLYRAPNEQSFGPNVSACSGLCSIPEGRLRGGNSHYIWLYENPQVRKYQNTVQNINGQSIKISNCIRLTWSVNLRSIVRNEYDYRCDMHKTVQQIASYQVPTETGRNVSVSNTNLLDKFFGVSLAINSTGNRIIVGTPHNDKVEYYTIDSNTLSLVKTYNGINSTDRNQKAFGYDVSLQKNGNILAIGSPKENKNGKGYFPLSNESTATKINSGAVYIIDIGLNKRYSYLKAPETSSQDYFGKSITLNNDGLSFISLSKKGVYQY